MDTLGWDWFAFDDQDYDLVLLCHYVLLDTLGQERRAL